MYSKIILAVLFVFFISCKSKSSLNIQKSNSTNEQAVTKDNVNPFATIELIPLPEGFKRSEYEIDSFATWLRKRGLKKDKTVYLFNGEEKKFQTAQFAVLDIPVGNKDLQQCADAVMRLRSEYLFASKRFSEILFIDNEDGKYQFTEPYTEEHFYQYLEKVFRKCGSASLSKQLVNKTIEAIVPGDVFIRGGFPGHAVIVMDVAANDKGEKVYLLAQSYMPAQDIHVLVNPVDKGLSPWYKLDDGNEIITPEYVFTRRELKTW